jgi:oligopeptide/dipeptide ABC transporter ATP-binding protein
MYAGRIVEMGRATDVLVTPQHPYTQGLLAASPRYARKGEPLATIAGQVPPPGARGVGCGFADRCPRVMTRCRETVPQLSAGEHPVACFAVNP